MSEKCWRALALHSFGTGCVRGSPQGTGEMDSGQQLAGNLQSFLRSMLFPGRRCAVICPGIMHYTRSQVGILDVAVKCLGVS